jgi:hypothetical protein
MTIRVVLALTLLCIALGNFAAAETSDSIPVAAPVMTGPAGKTGKTAFDSVWRIM